MRDAGNAKEQTKNKSSALIPPPRDWEIHFLPDHFEEVIDDNFGNAAQDTETYSFADGVLTLRETWRPKGYQTRVTLSDDGLTMWNQLLGRTIEVRCSDEPNHYLQSLPQFPRTVDEAVQVLKKMLRQEDLISLHLGLGQYIRNGFDLWRGNSELLRA